MPKQPVSTIQEPTSTAFASGLAWAGLCLLTLAAPACATAEDTPIKTLLAHRRPYP